MAGERTDAAFENRCPSDQDQLLRPIAAESRPTSACCNDRRDEHRCFVLYTEAGTGNLALHTRWLAACNGRGDDVMDVIGKGLRVLDGRLDGDRCVARRVYDYARDIRHAAE